MTQTGEHHRGQCHNPRTVTRTRTLILSSPRRRVRLQRALEPHKLKNIELPGVPSRQPCYLWCPPDVMLLKQVLQLLLLLHQLGDHHRSNHSDWLRDVGSMWGLCNFSSNSNAATVSGCEDGLLTSMPASVMGCRAWSKPSRAWSKPSKEASRTWWRLFGKWLNNHGVLLRVQSLVLLLLPLHPLHLLSSAEEGGVEGDKVLSEGISANVPNSSLCHFSN
ncbi:uncharacterized protein LOC121394511 [Xenopus laevis]|uniref:Uncharacterized protein LOC121394511 n=1 Tax=Xenopus laevis TaxID=8355 RepID=A0A8J1KY03_XENLA|nr:uncharacterized protein LOC121394511 [Xenopus laevis]